MKDLSNHLLVEAYQMAIQLQLQEDFIELIQHELAVRNIRVHS